MKIRHYPVFVLLTMLFGTLFSMYGHTNAMTDMAHYQTHTDHSHFGHDHAGHLITDQISASAASHDAATHAHDLPARHLALYIGMFYFTKDKMHQPPLRMPIKRPNQLDRPPK
ncbi:MAG: hypothetical protein DSY85_12540 [Marinomonas sp.]|nr:MAG: hypothetical protein DSY85_12540 [Marinomonas sp.]